MPQEPHWLPDVLATVAAFADATPETQADIVEEIRRVCGVWAADRASKEFAKLSKPEIKSPSIAPPQPVSIPLPSPAPVPSAAPSIRRKFAVAEPTTGWAEAFGRQAGEANLKPEPVKANLNLKPVKALPSLPIPEPSSPLLGTTPQAELRIAPFGPGQPAVVEGAAPEPAAVEEQAAAEASPSPVQLPAVIPPRPVAKYDAAIEMLNTQHAIIDNYGGKTVIASWEPSSLNPSKLVVVFQTKESFLLRYSNRFVTIDSADGRGGFASRSQPMGAYWLGHRDRRQYRGVTFMPGGPETGEGCLNLWQGWGVDPSPGDWSLIREHIEDIVADGNEEFADYVIRWIAWSIQNPARQAEVALVLIGSKGAGKGTLVRCLQRIFGAHAFQVTSREEVIGKFNGHLQDCILFVADEAYWGGDKRCVGRLQGMITEPTLPIERKGFDLLQVRNFLHVVMLAEPGWVIPAGRHERRYAALAVSDGARGDREYFKALHRQIDEGGAEAMMFDLQGMDLEDWHPREIPEALLKGGALQKQQGHTLPPLEQWYLSLLHDGVLPGALSAKPNKALTRSLLEDARAKHPRLRYDLSDVGLGNFLIDEERIGIACTKYRSAAANGWSFPPLAEAREAFDRLYGPIAWDNPDVVEWSKR